MIRFEIVNLGSFAIVKGGKRLPIGAEFSAAPTSHPYIRARDIGQGNVRIEDPVFLTEDVAQKLARYTVHAGDICLTIVGANVGDVGVVPKDLDGANLTENAVKIVTNGNADQMFLRYALLSSDAQAQMKVLAGGAAQPKLGIYKVETIEVPFPPLPVQQRIAGILSAYDELIENNQRRIKILEEMVRSLYREWFVNFCYPGHEKVPLVDCPLGPIPKGWEAGRIETLTSFLNRGLSPDYDDEGESLVVNQKCIRDQRLNLEPARRQQKPVPKEKLIRFGDILINSTGVGTLGRVAQVYDDFEHCTVDTHVTIVRSNDTVDVDFFGLAILNEQETFERSGVGATGQTELSRTAIGQVQLAIPPRTLQSRFGRLMRPMRSAISTMSKQVENLHRTRDLLLPRLISGEVPLYNRHGEGEVISA